MYPSNLSASYCQLKPPFSVMLQNQDMHWHQIKVKNLKELKRKNENSIRIILHSIKIINFRVLLLANSMGLLEEWAHGWISQNVRFLTNVYLSGKGPWSYPGIGSSRPDTSPLKITWRLYRRNPYTSHMSLFDLLIMRTLLSV